MTIRILHQLGSYELPMFQILQPNPQTKGTATWEGDNMLLRSWLMRMLKNIRQLRFGLDVCQELDSFRNSLNFLQSLLFVNNQWFADLNWYPTELYPMLSTAHDGHRQ